MFMGIRIRRCPFCRESINDKNKKFIKKHSRDNQYRCYNYKGHGWSSQSVNDKEWYYVTFSDKVSLEGQSYYYEQSTLYDANTYINEQQSFFTTKKVIEEIRNLDSSHLVLKYFQLNYPTLLNDSFNSNLITDNLNLQILLYHFKGLSQELIAEILHIKSRATVSTVLKNFIIEILGAYKKDAKATSLQAFKRRNKMDVKKFSLNCSIVHRRKDKKIIESKYYNKYDVSDFYYIN